MTKRNKKHAEDILSVAIAVIAAIALFGYIIPSYKNAENLGISVGDKMGTMVGKAVGSYNGITTGFTEGKKNGKKEGLSAKDTKSEIRNSFSEIGNLEVLEAGVKLEDVNTLGNDYAALYFSKGVAIYSINLQNVEIHDADTNKIEVLLPQIDVDVYIDEKETKKLAEYQKHSWTGNAKDGFLEYMNSRSIMDESIEKTMANYSLMMENAQNSAIKQVGNIAKAAVGNKKEVSVRFKEKQTNG